LARKTADMAGGVPMMMHITDSPIPLPELLAHMKPGDIVTHCYHGRAHVIMGQEKQLVLKEVVEAQRHGIIFDCAHGRSHFSFPLIEKAIERHGPALYGIVDDTSFPKQGTHSVGVARQYCGQLGKQDNCQVAVSLSAANDQASLPIAYRLFLPEAWANDPLRRAKAGVPEEVSFETKTAIALGQLRQAVADGAPVGIVLGDPASHEGIPVKLFLHLRLRSRLSAVTHFNFRPRWSSCHGRALPCEPHIRRDDVPTTVPHSGRESSRRAAPLYETAAFAPGRTTATPPWIPLPAPLGGTGSTRKISQDAGFITAPSGTTPWVANRHKAIRSRRAIATTMTLRMRFPVSPTRSRNQMT
jgi:hypothetical protein